MKLDISTGVEIVFYLVVNAVRVYVLYQLCGVFFRKVDRRKVRVIPYLAFYVMNSAAYLLLNNDWINLLISFGGFFVVLIFSYKAKLSLKFFVTCVSGGINIAVESLAWVIFSNHVHANLAENNIGFFLSVFLLFIFTSILKKLSDFYFLDENLKYGDFILGFVSLGSICICGSLVDQLAEKKVLFSWVSLVLLLINVAVYYLYDEIMKSTIKKAEEDFLRTQLSVYEHQLRIMENNMDEIHTLQHDMRHHFLVLSGYAKRKESAKILNYLDTFSEHLYTDVDYVHTQNSAIDGVVNYTIAQMQKLGGTCERKIVLPEKFHFNDYDLSIVLYNLLFNALEAVERADEKKLKIELIYRKGLLHLQIENSCDGKYKLADGNYMSTKSETGHGLGIKSVQRIVEKYDGEMEIKAEEDRFEVSAFFIATQS